MDNIIIILLFILIILLSLICLVKFNFSKFNFSKFNSGKLNSDKFNFSKFNYKFNSDKIKGGSKHVFLNQKTQKIKTQKIKIQKIKNQKIKNNETQKTYSISGNDGLDYSVLRTLLNSHSFIEVPNNTPYVYLSWGIVDIFKTTSYTSEFKIQKAYIKSIFDSKYITKFTYKNLLPQTINQLNPKLNNFLPKTVILKDIHTVSGQVFIVKAAVAFAQKGVQVISNDQELKAAKHRFHSKLNTTIASVYIKNPLLWKGKKTHVRPFILCYSDGHNPKCFVHDVFRVFTARKKYEQGDWLNTDIHITGADPNDRSLDDRIEWPNDFDLSPKLLAKCEHSLSQCIDEICKLIIAVSPKPYPDSKFAFEIFGPDIMLDDQGNAWLLEINNKCGFGLVGDKKTWDEFNKKRSYHLFNWIITHLSERIGSHI